MVTIDDIAREAGVSCTTVSNVIHNNEKKVSPATVARINEIIKRTGYVPSLSARTLKTKSSKVVALIDRLDGENRSQFASDPFLSTLTAAVEEALRERGYYLMIRAVQDIKELKAFLRNWNVEGVVIPGLLEEDSLFNKLEEIHMPIVLTDSFAVEQKNVVNVGLCDREGAYIATKHLIDNGHKNIAFVGPKIHKRGVIAERLEGYKAALKDNNIEYDQSLVFESEFVTDKMIALGASISRRNDITAIFATADILAAGIMSGIMQGGKKIPDDISIVGFDDINWCRMTNPMLTTIHQDTKEKGRIAAEQMLQLLEDKFVEENNIILPVSLVERDSVANISSKG